jgi:hypothetical protein
MRRRLYKYYSDRKWAEAFLDGKILFRSLSYFHEYDDANVRRDEHEGVSRFCPDAGLVGYNHTQQRPFILPYHAFESAVRTNEIFVFCMSRVFDETQWSSFDATVCVVILKIGPLCERIKAALPPTATFFTRRVEYYKQSNAPEARWALSSRIATSKQDSYAWQCEYRLVFSLTDAFEFEKVTTVLRQDGAAASAEVIEQPTYHVEVGNLRNVCRLSESSDLTVGAGTQTRSQETQVTPPAT